MTPPQPAAKCCNSFWVVADHEGCEQKACAACCIPYYALCCWEPTVYTSYDDMPDSILRNAAPRATAALEPGAADVAAANPFPDAAAGSNPDTAAAANPFPDKAAANPFPDTTVANPAFSTDLPPPAYNPDANPFPDTAAAANPFPDAAAANPFPDAAAANPFPDAAAANPFPDAAAANPFPDTAAANPFPDAASPPTPAARPPPLPAIAVELGLSQIDLAAYKHLWESAQSDDRLPAGAALKFFGKSGLDAKKEGTLRTMWGIADTEPPKGSLNEDEFFRACKLITIAQAGEKMSKDGLGASGYALPKLEGIAYPDAEITCPTLSRGPAEVCK